VRPSGPGDGRASEASYDVELAVPWAALGIEPERGALMGVDLSLDDAGLSKVSSTNWSGVIGFENPAQWNELILVEALAPGGAAAERDPSAVGGGAAPGSKPDSAADGAGSCGCAVAGRGSSAPCTMIWILVLLAGGVAVRSRSKESR
jgi:MYXO-CTERM domain-containing protein